jgi:hypothetical protein
MGISTRAKTDLRVESLDELGDLLHRRFIHHVGLVEDDDIGKFDLIGKAMTSSATFNIGLNPR